MLVGTEAVSNCSLHLFKTKMIFLEFRWNNKSPPLWLNG